MCNSLTKIARFSALVSHFGTDSSNGAAAHQILTALHQSPPRAYHNLTHVAACLDLLDSLQLSREQHDSIELALWFHDCIYVPQRDDNEARSADVAELILKGLGGKPEIITTVRRLILATRHVDPPTDDLEAIIQDIDLAILAAQSAEYKNYVAAIRAEYTFATDEQFKNGRRSFVESMLARPQIFHTATMHARFAAKARENLTAEQKAAS